MEDKQDIFGGSRSEIKVKTLMRPSIIRFGGSRERTEGLGEGLIRGVIGFAEMIQHIEKVFGVREVVLRHVGGPTDPSPVSVRGDSRGFAQQTENLLIHHLAWLHVERVSLSKTVRVSEPVNCEKEAAKTA